MALRVLSVPAFFSLRFSKTPVLCAAGFIAAFNVVLLQFGMIFFMREHFHAEGGTVGLFASLASVTYLAGCLTLTGVYKKFPPGKLLAASALTFVVCSSVMAFSNIMAAAFAAQAAAGLANTFLWPPMQGWLAEGGEGAALNKRMSAYNFSWSAGTLSAPFISGFLGDINIYYPLYTAVALYAAEFVMFLVLFKGLNWGAEAASKKSFGEAMSRSQISIPKFPSETAADARLRWAAWIGMFFTFVIIGVFSSIYPLYAAEGMGFSKALAGFVLLVRSLVMTVVFMWLGRHVFWHYNGAAIVWAQTFAALAALVMAFSLSPFADCAMAAVLGSCAALSYASSQFHGVAGARERDKRSAAHEIFISTGFFTGSYAGGLVYQAFSMRVLFCSAAALLLAGAAATALMTRGKKTQTGNYDSN
jgi:MFS family permease